MVSRKRGCEEREAVRRGREGGAPRIWVAAEGKAKMSVESRLRDRVKRKVHLAVSWSDATY